MSGALAVIEESSEPRTVALAALVAPVLDNLRRAQLDPKAAHALLLMARAALTGAINALDSDPPTHP